PFEAPPPPPAPPDGAFVGTLPPFPPAVDPLPAVPAAGTVDDSAGAARPVLPAAMAFTFEIPAPPQPGPAPPTMKFPDGLPAAGDVGVVPIVPSVPSVPLVPYSVTLHSVTATAV